MVRTFVVVPVSGLLSPKRRWDGFGYLLELGTLGDVFDRSGGDRQELSESNSGLGFTKGEEGIRGFLD